MTDYTARYKNPTPVIVMIAIALTGGYMACFGMIADNKEIARNRAAKMAEARRVLTPQEINARTMIDLYGEDWYGKGCGQRRCK